MQCHFGPNIQMHSNHETWKGEEGEKEKKKEEGETKRQRTSSCIFKYIWMVFLFFLSPIPDLYPFPWYLLCLRCLSQSIFTSLLFLDSLPFFEDVVFIVFWTFFSWCESVCFSKEFISCSRLNIFHQDFLEERETGRRKSSWYVVGKEGIRSRYFFLFFFPVKSHTTKWLQWWMNVCVIVFLEDKELMAETEIGSLRLWERRWYTRSCKTSLQISLLLLPNQL